jgi:hypothetical protein
MSRAEDEDTPQAAQRKRIEDLLGAGSEIAGGIAGSALTLFMPGMEGTLASGLVTPIVTRTLQKIGGEITQRVLSPREEARIGATFAFAYETIQQNLASGRPLREDGFFESAEHERAAAEEVVEGVLLAAQRAYEEKKLRYYGRLIGNLAFRPDVDRGQANLLIRLADRLSYRQYCLIALLAQRDTYAVSDMYPDQSRHATGMATVGLLNEIRDLYVQGVVDASGEIVNNIGDVRPARLRLAGLGELLAALMELGDIPPEDLEPVAALLRWEG